MNRTHALIALVAVGCASGSALADKVHITGGNGLDFNLKAGDFGDIFGNVAGNQLSGSELRDIHESINAAGISTEGVVTFILANTNAGLSIFALVDNNLTEGPKDLEAMIGLSTTINGDAAMLNNDGNFFANGGTFADDGSSSTLAGDMFWRPDGGATGMAWAGLEHGESGSFDFSAFMGEDGEPSTFTGLAGASTFQFVSWTGSTWNLKRTGDFSSDGSFSFSFAVVPLPPAVAMGLAGIGIVAVARRRRRAAKQG